MYKNKNKNKNTRDNATQPANATRTVYYEELDELQLERWSAAGWYASWRERWRERRERERAQREREREAREYSYRWKKQLNLVSGLELLTGGTGGYLNKFFERTNRELAELVARRAGL